MLFLFCNNTAYDVATFAESVGATERSERRVANERAFIGDHWESGIYLIQCGSDMVF